MTEPLHETEISKPERILEQIRKFCEETRDVCPTSNHICGTILKIIEREGK